MVRVLLLSAGGRGDVEPYCAIVKQLLKDSRISCLAGRNDTNNRVLVDFFVQSNFQYLVQPFERHPSFRLFPFPFGGDDFYEALKDGPLLHGKDANPRLENVEKLSKIVGKVILPCLGQVVDTLDTYNVNEKCVIITSAFTRPLALLLAKHRTNVRVVLLHLQPLVPNGLFPSYRTHRMEFVRRCLELTSCNKMETQNVELNPTYEDSYWTIEKAIEDFFLKDRLGEICAHVLGKNAKPYSFEELKKMLTGRHPQVWVANAYSNLLIPKLAGLNGLGTNIVDVGPLADNYVPYGHESLESILEEFLSFDDKPICVSFGSMPCRNIGAVLGACKALKVRAVLVGDVFRQIPETHPALRFKRIIRISSAPFSLLLPRCSMMLCHGGIGVVQACLRAGIPCLVSPLMGDQFALAQLLEGMGLGTQCGSRLSEVTTQDIINAFRVGENCYSRCCRFAESIRHDQIGENDLQAIVDLVHDLG